MKQILSVVLGAWACWAQTAEEWPTGPRITPPTIASVSPQGIARGNTLEMSIEGFNLAKASAIYFSEPGVKGRIVRIKELPDLPDIRIGSNGAQSSIDLGPLPPRNQVTVEIEVAASAKIGPVSFRLLTPLGTSPAGTFLVEPFYGRRRTPSRMTRWTMRRRCICRRFLWARSAGTGTWTLTSFRRGRGRKWCLRMARCSWAVRCSRLCGF